MVVEGLLLAAGAGRRMGRPKALVEDWLVRSIHVLLDGGCATVTVVLGAAAEEARALLPPGVGTVVAEDWPEGMGASLRAGLAGLARESDPDFEALAGARAPRTVGAALVQLVDLPDVSSAVVARVLTEPVDRSTLRRATFRGRPGHPVLLGRDHWAGTVEAARGDKGARDYLAAHPHELVECGDLATGEDVDSRA